MTTYSSPDQWKHVMKITGCRLPLVLFIFSTLFITVGTPALGAPPESPPFRETSADDLILKAARAADHAWEEFHRAAIGGTLASPALQVTIEGQLHEVRALLMEARKADRAQQFHSVKAMTEKIFAITNNIVKESQERKL